MHRLILLLSMGFCVIHAESPLPVEVGKPVSRSGAVFVSISNTSSRPIGSFLVEATVFAGSKKRAVVSQYMDELVNASNDKALLPGESRELYLGPQELIDPSLVVVEFVGALYRDGVFVGLDRARTILIGRRKRLNEELSRCAELLQDSQGHSLSQLKATIDARKALNRNAGKENPTLLGAVEGVSTLVTDWLQGGLEGAPAECDSSCVASRIRYLNAGLQAWRAKILEDKLNVEKE